jgi:hypothetical protein
MSQPRCSRASAAAREAAIDEVLSFLSSQLAPAYRSDREKALQLVQQHGLTLPELIEYRIRRFLKGAGTGAL